MHEPATYSVIWRIRWSRPIAPTAAHPARRISCRLRGLTKVDVRGAATFGLHGPWLVISLRGAPFPEDTLVLGRTTFQLGFTTPPSLVVPISGALMAQGAVKAGNDLLALLAPRDTPGSVQLTSGGDLAWVWLPRPGSKDWPYPTSPDPSLSFIYTSSSKEIEEFVI